MTKYLLAFVVFGSLAATAIWHERTLAAQLQSSQDAMIQLEKSVRSARRDVQSLTGDSVAMRSVIGSQVRSQAEDRALLSNLARAPRPASEAEVESPAQAVAPPTEPGSPDPFIERTRDTLQASFDGQLYERGWSADAETNLKRRATELMAGGGEVRSIQCRTSMCRIETVQPSAESLQTFILAFSKSREFPQMFYTQTDTTPDGRPIITMFVAKEGVPLPYANER